MLISDRYHPSKLNPSYYRRLFMKLSHSIVIPTILIVLISLLVQAADSKITIPHQLPENFEQKEAIRHEMFFMLADISALAKATENDRVLENDLNYSQGKRILEGINKVEKLDVQNYLKTDLSKLKTLTDDLLKAIEEKKPTAIYSEQIFSACFSCHQKHIKPDQPSLKK